MACLIRRAFVLLAVALLVVGSTPIADAADEYQVEITHRVNAHGDEYMAVTVTPDDKWVVIGTEKGDLIVWGIEERRVLKTLHQGTPIHAVIASAEGHTVFTGGGPHTGKQQFGVVRKWNLDDGTFVDLKSPGLQAVMAFDANSKSDLVAASDMKGRVAVWNMSRGEAVGSTELKQSANGLSIFDRSIVVSTVDVAGVLKGELGQLPPSSIFLLSVDRIQDVPRRLLPGSSGKMWGALRFSPVRPLLAASYSDRSGAHSAVFDLVKGTQIGIFTQQTTAWAPDGSLLLFGMQAPVEWIRFGAGNEISRSDLVPDESGHAEGNPTQMAGQVVSRGLKAWSVFQMNAALSQCDLMTKTCEVFHRAPGLPFAMDVVELKGRMDLIATGGDDGFVRVWNAANDFSLAKEFRVSSGVPQGVALLTGGKVVFSSSGKEAPTEIVSGDLASGVTRVLLKVPAPYVQIKRAAGGFIYNLGQSLVLANADTGATLREFTAGTKFAMFSVSANGEWVAAADESGSLFSFEVSSGKLVATSKDRVESLNAMAVSNDGQYVYTGEFKGSLQRWEPRRDVLKEIGHIRGQAKTMRVSSDGKRITVGGNHRDVSVYDSKGGNPVAYFQTPASDFYVTNTWISGDRLVFTADSGVLLAVTLKQ